MSSGSSYAVVARLQRGAAVFQESPNASQARAQQTNQMIHRMVKRIKVAGAADEDVTGDVTRRSHDNAPRRPHYVRLYSCGMGGAGGKVSTSTFPPGKHIDTLGFRHLANFPRPRRDTLRALGSHARCPA